VKTGSLENEIAGASIRMRSILVVQTDRWHDLAMFFIRFASEQKNWPGQLTGPACVASLPYYLLIMVPLTLMLSRTAIPFPATVAAECFDTAAANRYHSSWAIVVRAGKRFPFGYTAGFVYV
jgi:hypothetical protein